MTSQRSAVSMVRSMLTPSSEAILRSCSQARMFAAEPGLEPPARENAAIRRGVVSDDDDLDGGDLHGERRPARRAAGDAGDERRQGLDARALSDLHIIVEDDRHADRGNQRRQAEPAAQRPVSNAFDRPPLDRRSTPSRRTARGAAPEEKQGTAVGNQSEEADQRDEAPDHEDIAMGEVDHADDPVDHRIADRDQPIDRSERHPLMSCWRKYSIDLLSSACSKGQPASSAAW